MESLHQPQPRVKQRPLRAYVEIVDGELVIIPIAECDTDERDIRDAFRIFFDQEEAPQEK